MLYRWKHFGPPPCLWNVPGAGRTQLKQTKKSALEFIKYNRMNIQKPKQVRDKFGLLNTPQRDRTTTWQRIATLRRGANRSSCCLTRFILTILLLDWQGFATEDPRNAIARRLHDLIMSGLCSKQAANVHVYMLYLRQEHSGVIVTVVMR